MLFVYPESNIYTANILDKKVKETVLEGLMTKHLKNLKTFKFHSITVYLFVLKWMLCLG